MSNYLHGFCYVQNATISALPCHLMALLTSVSSLGIWTAWDFTKNEQLLPSQPGHKDPESTQDAAQHRTALITILKASVDIKNPKIMPIV